MRFLWLSPDGDGMGIALRVLEEGNDVRMFVLNPDLAEIGDGLVPKCAEDFSDLEPDTVIVSDSTGAGYLCDMFRMAGFPVVGGSRLADRLEKDRAYAREVMKGCGIKVPKSMEFTDWDKAIEFAQDIEEAVVFKPEGELSGVLPSDVADNGKELVDMLGFYRLKIPSQPKFSIEEFLEGTDISTEGYFNGQNFIRPFNHTLEEKRTWTENLGASGGCAGNLVWASDSGLVEETVLKLEDFLRGERYVGPIDLNAIVNEQGVFGLEFTPRFGYDSEPTLYWGLMDGEIGRFLSDVARGQTVDMPLLPGFAAGVRLSIPPWPSEKFPAPEGIPVRGLTPAIRERFYPYQLHQADGEIVTIQGQGIIGVALGYSEDVDDAFRTAYKTAEKITIRHKQYRVDLLEEFERDLKHLAALVDLGVSHV